MVEDAIWPVETLELSIIDENEIALLVIIGSIIAVFEGVWLQKLMSTEVSTILL